jgi:hypothetical protein
VTLTAFPIDASSGSPSYLAQQFRQTMGALTYNGTARTLGAQSGIWPDRNPTITASSTTWTVTPFAAVVDAAFTTTQGAYFVAADANLTGSVTAAAGSARIDLLYIQVNDTVIDSSGSRNATVSYLAGTAGAGVPPATPARSVAIANINVPASGGGSPTVTNVWPYAVAAGGILPVANAAAYPASPVAGMVVYNLALGSVFIYNGASWVKYLPGPQLVSVAIGSLPTSGTERSATGSIVVTPSAATWSQTVAGLGLPFAISSGYNIHVTPGDNNGGLSQVTFVASSSSLTTIVGQAWTTTGAACSGVAVRINYTITGA